MLEGWLAHGCCERSLGVRRAFKSMNRCCGSLKAARVYGGSYNQELNTRAEITEGWRLGGNVEESLGFRPSGPFMRS